MWALTTLLDADVTLKYLAYLGWDPSKPLTDALTFTKSLLLSSSSSSSPFPLLYSLRFFSPLFSFILSCFSSPLFSILFSFSYLIIMPIFLLFRLGDPKHKRTTFLAYVFGAPKVGKVLLLLS